MFESDYIMRQIQLMTRAFAKVFFHKDVSALELFDEEDDLSASGVLYHKLKRLVGEGQINAAEQLLFDEIDTNPLPSYFHTAIQFYQDLAALSNAQLNLGNFSREEIALGLNDVARIYGVDPDQIG